MRRHNPWRPFSEPDELYRQGKTKIMHRVWSFDDLHKHFAKSVVDDWYGFTMARDPHYERIEPKNNRRRA